MLLSFLAKATGIDLPYTSDEIGKAVELLVGIVGFLITVYGRYRKGDINIFGFKKPAPQVEVKMYPSRYDDLE